MFNWLTVAMTVGGAVAPYVVPLLQKSPAWAQALITAVSAGVGALYHLYQPPPK